MRATRMEVLEEREQMPLVVRARFEKTFFGLGVFAVLILLLGGGYLMMDALVDPLRASEMGVLAAGFALALSSFLLVYLLCPRRRIELARREDGILDEGKSPVLTVYGETVQNRLVAKQVLGAGKNLPGPM